MEALYNEILSLEEEISSSLTVAMQFDIESDGDKDCHFERNDLIEWLFH